MTNRIMPFIIRGALAALTLIGSARWAARAESVGLSEVSHIHGISVDPGGPAHLYLGTHHGVWLTWADGTAERVSDNANDYMGFTPHPSEDGVFLGSGHPAEGGNVGLMPAAGVMPSSTVITDHTDDKRGCATG